MGTDVFTRIVFFMCILRHTIGQEPHSSAENATNTVDCYDDQFKCSDGKKCVEGSQECDTIIDCADSSDEHKLCKTFTCDSGDVKLERFHCDGFFDCDDSSDEAGCQLFECENGKTVTEKQVCDEIDDCGDKYHSDECNCTYTFTCANGKCISKDLTCDQVNDCGDNSDEDTCPTAKFTCFDGQIIEASLKCDGKGDCNDTSDECVCTRTYTCDNNRCISAYLLNDGKDDCGDGSDETIVQQTTAPSQETTDAQHTGEVTSVSRTENTDESSGSEIDIANRIVTSAVPNRNVTISYMTSQSKSNFTCADGMIIDSKLLCDGADDCQDGYRSDECNCDDTFECAGETGRKRCILSDLRCDGYDDCKDNLRSDECGCDDTFTCSITKECLSKTVLCDGKEDCSDGSDENPEISGCPELKKCDGGFLCGNGKCINKTLECDGTDDCGDCSDESKCSRSSELFRCKNGQCIEKRKHCDGNNDCPNADDEDDCYVNGKITTESTTPFIESTKQTVPVQTKEHAVTQPGNSGVILHREVSYLTCFLGMLYLSFCH